MAATKGKLEGRCCNCFKKYRIFFLFVATILCFQVYLAYLFFALESHHNFSSQLSSGEIDIRLEKDERLYGSSRQMKLPPDKQNKNSNRTRLKLDPESLNFKPACEVVGKEAVSAITRARTQICKQLLVNVSCLSQQGKLYPDRLYSSCPHSPGFINNPKSLGCFKDDKLVRLLPDYYTIFKNNNSPEECAFLCQQSGYPYAGTEYSVECFCGMEEPQESKRLPNFKCIMKCSGNAKYSCGGYLAMNVYHTGIQKFKVQEARNMSSRNEKDKSVRIAYLLTVNGRASRQVKRLINMLYNSKHFYYIHVDARQDYMYREMLKVEKTCQRNNIKIANGVGLRHASIWGGASLLTTFLTSAQQMLKYFPHWDYLVNLSESDLPIKSNNLLVDFLTVNKGLNFVKSHGREVQRFITKQGLDKTFYECEARMWRLGDRKFPKGVQIDGGSDWVALSRDFVQYVSNPNADNLINGLKQVFQYTLLPAESFFHTALRNSRFCNTYVDNNLRVTNWKRKLGCKCQYKAVVDWCGCSPNDFKLDDFYRIQSTADKNLFFARKFEPVIDQRIINKIDDWLSSSNNSQIKKGYDLYWQNIYHHADLSPPNDNMILTVSNSLARIIYKKFNLHSDNVKLLETTAYFKENKFNAILILTEVNTKLSESSTYQNDIPERVEAMITFKRNFTISKTWSNRINSLSVNTDYDQKEQTFRNFLGGIGPTSNPIFAYEFDSSLVTPRNLTLLWIDPNGYIVYVNHFLVEDYSLIGSVNPQLDEPLLVGKWNVLLVNDINLIAQLSFFITPLEYWKNRKITQRKLMEINRGPVNNQKKIKNVDKWSELLKKTGIKTSTDDGNKNNNSINIKNGFELSEWIDEIVNQYYKINDICLVNESQLNKKYRFKKCSQTNWSSLSPDFKSDINYLCDA